MKLLIVALSTSSSGLMFWNLSMGTAFSRRLRLPISLGVLFLSVMGSMVAVENAFGQDVETKPEKLFEPREYAGEQGQVLAYRLLKPVDFDPSKKYPLVIFLHGAGERGDDNVAQLKHGMADFCKPDRRKQYPCYVLAPQCPKGQKWSDVDWSKREVTLPENVSTSLGLTFDVVDYMLEHSAVDPKRVYITGLSMGGYGTWDALARRPSFFAAAMPICGGGDPATAKLFAETPISCFHGDADRAVPVEQSRNLIKALKEAGGAPLYKEYKGVGHDSWTQTYAAEENFKWLFSQQLKKRS